MVMACPCWSTCSFCVMSLETGATLCVVICSASLSPGLLSPFRNCPFCRGDRDPSLRQNSTPEAHVALPWHVLPCQGSCYGRCLMGSWGLPLSCAGCSPHEGPGRGTTGLESMLCTLGWGCSVQRKGLPLPLLTKGPCGRAGAGEPGTAQAGQALLPVVPRL